MANCGSCDLYGRERCPTHRPVGTAAVLHEPRYRTVVVDPPWPQKGGGTLKGREGWHDSHGASMPLRYSTMSVDEIAALPVRDVVDPSGAHLYLWATNGFLPVAFDVLRSWGFTYSTALVWGKRPMGGGLGGAFGISTEFVLFARRGTISEPRRARVRGTWWLEDDAPDVGALWEWKRPYDDRGKPMGSAKPPEFHRDVVEAASPGPYLEMFARRSRPGWDVWGDEAPNAVDLPCLSKVVA